MDMSSFQAAGAGFVLRPGVFGLFRCRAFLGILFGGSFFFLASFVTLRTLAFAVICRGRLAPFFRTNVRLALLRFEPILRTARRFFALAIAAALEIIATLRPQVYESREPEREPSFRYRALS
jgi:hypothetical protein